MPAKLRTKTLNLENSIAFFKLPKEMGSIQKYYLSNPSTSYKIRQIINSSNKLYMTMGLGEYM